MPISAENGRTMIFINYIIPLLFFCVTWADSQKDIESNDLNDVKSLDNNDINSTLSENNVPITEKVRIELYLESLCPYCVGFEVNELASLIENMNAYVNISTYPFGNAMMREDNGTWEFKCQHGPTECYGNKLHACAIDVLQNTTALLYNICLMNSTQGSGSDDESADRCGRSMDTDSKPIKECAKGTRGMELLRYYGEESEKANFSHVPYVLINGKEFDGYDFEITVCNAFTNPPPVCK